MSQDRQPLTFNDVHDLAKEYEIPVLDALADNVVVNNLEHLFENLERFVEDGFSDIVVLENFLRVVVQSFEPPTIEQVEYVEAADDNNFWVYTLGTTRLLLSNDFTLLTIAKKVSFLDDEE